MQVGKVSLWFSWGRKGKAEFTPPPSLTRVPALCCFPCACVLLTYYVPGILLGPETLKINKIHFLSSGSVAIGTVNFHH